MRDVVRRSDSAKYIQSYITRRGTPTTRALLLENTLAMTLWIFDGLGVGVRLISSKVSPSLQDIYWRKVHTGGDDGGRGNIGLIYTRDWRSISRDELGQRIDGSSDNSSVYKIICQDEPLYLSSSTVRLVRLDG